jgi:signal transduction histidine kinase/ActR/RegA family two-component response regulator
MVTATGILLWILAAVETIVGHTWRDYLFLLIAIPLVVIIVRFPLSWRLPSAWKSVAKNLTFTLGDAFVLAIAGWFGFGPAVLIAGIEAFMSSRRQVQRTSSNLFSAANVAIAAAAGSVCLGGLMGNGWLGAAINHNGSVSTVAAAMLVAGFVQVNVNWGPISALVAMRHNNSVWLLWKQGFWHAAPMFLPTSVAATLLFFGAQNGAIATLAICGPVLLAVYFSANQNRSRAEQAEKVEHDRAEDAERHVAELSLYIAEQERIHKQFAQLEKLSALGELASGVAHDFNNTLAGILGRAQLVQAHRNDTKEVERGLDIIIKAARDGAHTVKRIQDFARQRRDHDFQVIAVGPLLFDVSEVTQPRWKTRAEAADIGINLEVVVNTSATVMGDASELREVLVNIVFNAIDAMPSGGRITLSAAEVNGQVEIRVTDNGTGMPEEVRSRIFDPFFTTKGEAGMGLGLAVSYGIVCRHGGTLEVESELGRGTSFIIRLAAATQAAPGQVEAIETFEAINVAPVGIPVPAVCRILVVDDEPAVRELLKDILVSLGHRVVQAEDGFKAIQLFDADVFDAVFTDISMPGMSGWELARLIRERNMKIPLAILSGWGEAIGPDQQKAAQANWIVAKPFDFEQIIAIVEEVSANQSKLPKPKHKNLTLVA